MKRVVLFLAEGFEEIEAVTPVDVLKRGGVEVVIAGVGSDVITGSHGLTIDTDAVAEEINIDEFDGVVLPGGLPGAVNLSESAAVNDILKKPGMKESLSLLSAHLPLSFCLHWVFWMVNRLPGIRG